MVCKVTNNRSKNPGWKTGFVEADLFGLLFGKIDGKCDLASSMAVFFSSLLALLIKDFRVEFRQRILTATLLLFVGSSCFTLYQVFFAGKAQVNPLVWNAVFWLIVLFSSFQAVGRNLVREMDRQFWYYRFVSSAESLIVSKLIYHFLLLNITSFLGWGFLSVFFKNPVQDSLLFVIAIQLCCIGLSAGLTLVSAIAAKAESNAALLPVLGFPLVIPTLLFVLRISVTAVDGLDWEMAWKNIWTLLGIDSIMIALSILLFPYLWRQ